MWFEAVFSGEDLGVLARQFMPVTIPIGDGSITLSDPTGVALIVDVGVRIVCKAQLTWPLLGIRIPVLIHTLAVVARGEILNRAGVDELVFKLEVEHADFAGIPTLIDKRITEKINKELADREIELSWKYPQTLSHTFGLPAALVPLESLALRTTFGRVKVTSEALFFTVAFESAVNRRTSAVAGGE